MDDIRRIERERDQLERDPGGMIGEGVPCHILSTRRVFYFTANCVYSAMMIQGEGEWEREADSRERERESGANLFTLVPGSTQSSCSLFVE